MSEIKSYPLTKDGMTALKNILYEYNSHPPDSMSQLEDTISTIECRIRDLTQLKKEEALSENDARLLKLLVMMKDDLDKLWLHAYRAFEDVTDIFGSLERIYSEENISEMYIDDGYHKGVVT